MAPRHHQRRRSSSGKPGERPIGREHLGVREIRVPAARIRENEQSCALEAVALQAATLRVAELVARDAPHDKLFKAAAQEAARVFGAESGSVIRYVGDERAVIVGVWRPCGRRGLPVNAAVDFGPASSRSIRSSW